MTGSLTADRPADTPALTLPEALLCSWNSVTVCPLFILKLSRADEEFSFTAISEAITSFLHAAELLLITDVTAAPVTVCCQGPTY